MVVHQTNAVLLGMSVVLLGMEGYVRLQTVMVVRRELIIANILLAVFLRVNYVVFRNLKNYFSSLTALTNTLAGLNAGMSCAGMVIVVFLVMFLAAFLALCFTMKLPNPRR